MMFISCSWMGKVHARGAVWAWRSMPEVFLLFFFFNFTRAIATIITFPESHLHFKKTHMLTFTFLSWLVTVVCRLTSSKHSANPKFSADAKSTQQEAKATLAKADVREEGLLPLPFPSTRPFLVSFHLWLRVWSNKPSACSPDGRSTADSGVMRQ